VDNSRYAPNIQYFGIRIASEKFTTPIAYMTSIPLDPFRSDMPDDTLKRYGYDNVRQQVEAGIPDWPPNDLRRYGDWRLISFGPQREYLAWMPYDPTNGTVSVGNILRTQLSPEGRILFTYWDPSNPTI
jgi:hypothetical protein